MTRSFTLFVLAAAVCIAHADISVSRTVDSIASGYAVKLVASSGCTGSDDYGSTDCNFKWGDTVAGTVTATLPATGLATGSKVSVSLKVDGFIPFDQSCDICGPTPCTITIPVIKKTVTIKVPPCPINPAAGPHSFSVVLPSKSPVPVTTEVKGSVSLTDASGAVLLKVDVNGKISTSAEEAEEPEWIWDLSALGAEEAAVEGKAPLFALRGSSAATDGAACESDTDKAAWAKNKPTFQDDMTACGQKCLGGSACVTSCIQKKDNYSAECSACFGALAGCTKQHCMLKCMGGPSDACNACVKSNCDGTFSTCSGIHDLPPTLAVEQPSIIVSADHIM